MPHVVRLDHIDTVYLSSHTWPIGLTLPVVRHVTLSNNLVALKIFSSFPSSIRSIEILLHPYMSNFMSSNWSVLRSLSSLPILFSLHIVSNDINTGLDEVSCQMVVEAVPMLIHFGFHFRSRTERSASDCIDQHVQPDLAELGLDADELENIIVEEEELNQSLLYSLFNMYGTSIEELHRCILRLSFDSKPLIAVKEEGYGLDVWV